MHTSTVLVFSLIGCCLVASDRLVGYAGFDHILVYDKDTQFMAAYDVRRKPASLHCDIMHYPPVVPPTYLNDYVVSRKPSNLRLFHSGGELFTLMDGDTGAYVTYACEGFRPFLSALPCKVHGIGEFPQAAGTKSIFAAGPSRAIIYDSASGEISVHFIDHDVVSGLAISKSPLGYTDKPLRRNLPGVGGDVSIAVSTEANILLAYKPATRNLKVFKYDWSAGPTDELLGRLLYEKDNLLPKWVHSIVSVENNIVIAYDAQSSQYIAIHVNVTQSGAFEYELSTAQPFASQNRGFLQGHGCLHDDRFNCLKNEGCGWCVTNQSCHHMGEGIPCDVKCDMWCHEDSLTCLNNDEARKSLSGPPANKTFDPKLVSPKDVDAGVIADRPLLKSDLDEMKIKTGIDFDAPENNSVNCMNSGFKEKSVEDETGCSDSDDRQRARENILASTDHMNAASGRITVIEKNVRHSAGQQPPSEDCLETQVDGVKVDLAHDAPLSEEEGAAPVPVSADGGRWGMSSHVIPVIAPTNVQHATLESDPVRLADSTNSIPDARKAMTQKRLRRIKRVMNAEPHFSPNQGSTLSGHDLMNGEQTKFSSLHVVGDSVLDGAHVTDESVLSSPVSKDDFVPQQGDASVLTTTSKYIVSGALQFKTIFFDAWIAQNAAIIQQSLAEAAHVSHNDVQLIRFEPSGKGTVSVQYSIDAGANAEVQTTLWQAIQYGRFDQILHKHQFSYETVLEHSKPSLTFSGNHLVGPSVVTEKSTSIDAMESGCEEDGIGNIKTSDFNDSNFMNGAALSDSHKDDDGFDASQIIATYTEKQLQSFSLDELVGLLNKYNLPAGSDVTKDAAIELLKPVVTAPVATQDDATRQGTSMGIASHSIYSSDSAPSTEGELLSRVVKKDELALPENPITVPVASTEGNTVKLPHIPPRKQLRPVKVTPAPSFLPVGVPEVTMPRPELPPNGDLAIEPDGSLNTVKLDDAANIRGVPIAVDPLGSVIVDPRVTSRREPPREVNIRDRVNPAKIKVLVGEPGPVMNLQLAEDVLPVEVPFSALSTASSNTGHPVDPLIEYRDLDEQDDDVLSDSPDVGCVSSEDAYTGNSQPRIDFVGNSQLVHVQPLVSFWAVYNVSSGQSTSRGALSRPYHPIRRSYLGGPDHRFVEHFPVSGGFKFFKCPDQRFETCEAYAQGQWERTIHTNDVIVALTDHLVLAVNQDKGTWRIFNFDRDVSGNSDPFSTATPPIAAGAFPEFADDEVVLLSEGVLMVHDPRTDRIRLFSFDAHKKEITGPSHEGYLTTEGFHRVTSMGDGRIIVFRPRTKTYRVMSCDYKGCSTANIGYLHASAGMESTPDLKQLFMMDAKTSLSWNQNENLLYVSDGTVFKVSAESSVIENLNPSELPPASAISAVDTVIAVAARPGHPSDMLLTVSSGADSSQLFLQRDGALFDLAVDPFYTYSAGQFSPDGQLFAYASTLLERRVENIPEATGSIPSTVVFVVEVESVYKGKPNPTAVRVYPHQVTLGPFSGKGRYLAIAVDNLGVPEDNNIDLVDLLSGQVHSLTALPEEREPSQWKIDTGAAFHPITNQLYVLSNENTNFYGLQKIDVHGSGSSSRKFVLQFDNDITHVSFSSDFTRCAVTVNNGGFAEFHVYHINSTSGRLVELKRPFLATLKAAPTAMLMSPDGTRMAMSKWTADENGQVYLTKIVELPKADNVTTEGSGKRTNSTSERLPIVSIPIRITKSRVDLPTSILNLGQPLSVSFDSFDGTPISAFVFPPSLAPLSEVLTALNSSSHNSTSNSTVRLAEPKLTRKPAYVVLVHDGPKSFAPAHLWGSALSITLNFLRSFGIGVLVPSIRGSTGSGKHFSLMDVQAKRLHAISDIQAAQSFLCSDQILADCDNIAVAGWSYGGFASLSVAGEHPDIWKAVIAGAAISDFKTHYETVRPRSQRNILEREYGSNAELLEHISPVNVASNIKAPVLMLHGISDTAVSVDQAEEMVAALRAYHKDVKYLPITGQGHEIDTHRVDGHRIEAHHDKLTLGGAVAEFLTGRFELLGNDI